MKYTIYFITFLHQLCLILARPQINTNCPIGDTSCLVSPEQAIATFISTSLPQLGREKLEPLFIDFVPIVDNLVQFYIRNLHVEGLKNLVVDDVSVDVTSRVIRLQFYTDFVMYMVYNTTGTLLSVPFYGDGNYKLNLDSSLIDMVIPYNIIKDAKGSDIIDLQSYHFTFDVRDGAQFDLTNLYDGDKCLSDKMHKGLRDNWKYVIQKYAGNVFNKVNDQVFDSLRNLISSTPLDNIV